MSRSRHLDALWGVLFLVVIPPGVARGQACPDRADWPTVSWPSRVQEYAQARGDEISELEEYAFTLVGTDKEKRGVRTDAVVIVQGGAIVYERYARGFGPHNRHLSWSVAKSVMNGLIGRAQAVGALDIDDSVCDYLASAPADKCGMRVKDLLEFSSGLDWKESYEGESNQESSVLAMLYGEGHRDMAAFVLSHALRDPPGTTFAYSTGDAVVLGAIAVAALEPTYGERFAWDLLFDEVGMTSTVIERDEAGSLIGGSYVYATPRDYARYGYLFLNDGCWDGQRLLPEGWVAESTTPSLPYRLHKMDPTEEDVAGRMWWLNRPVSEIGIDSPWPDVPEDLYTAIGHWGQYIAVVPSLDLVIVRTGDDRDGTFDRNEFFSLAIEVGRAL